jgi:hypothetical protein
MAISINDTIQSIVVTIMIDTSCTVIVDIGTIGIQFKSLIATMLAGTFGVNVSGIRF